MSLLTLNNVCLSFGSREIFSNLSLQVTSGDHIGLTGANGRGKTTLFKIFRGEQTIDSGEVHMAKNSLMGYLPQEMEFSSEKTVIEHVMSNHTNTEEIREKIYLLENQLKIEVNENIIENLAHELAEFHEELINNENLYSPHEAEMILMGLGFKITDFNRKIDEFSGGWKMRIHLASLLFMKPDLLLLDEPTNHLDLPSLTWLDQYLSSYKKTMIMISHDRDFLDRHVKRIFALEPEGFRQYKGNYTQSRLLREEEEKILENRRRNVEKERKQLENFIEKFKAKATKARQAKSKAKFLKKLDEVETLEYEEHFVFRFPKPARCGDRAIVLEEISKSFGTNQLYKGISHVVSRGRKIGIVGVNGTGKTTLLRIIAGELKPDTGKILEGSGVKLSYYAQHQAQALDISKTIVEEVRMIAPSLGETMVRNILGAFLFKGEDADKLIKVLSGGEKARVALAKLLVNPGNVLLLDEPTNHLDLESSEALLQALAQYDGTILFVSHNRSFLDNLANEIWEINDNTLSIFPGNFSEYNEHLHLRDQSRVFIPVEGLSQQKTSGISEIITSDENRKKATKSDRRKKEAKLREILLRETGPIKKKIAELEKRIGDMEERQDYLEKSMADPESFSRPEFPDMLREFKENQSKLEDLMGRWSYQSELYESKKSEIESRQSN
ncbi:MAG: ABC-F family ATP-binding cassette domain-containing protein [Deltaproteobacteria bacterium]|nr:ABC-F family ATP-binding cassette domain-containing protein [Deltaproteobacteria bacterium]